MPVAVSAVAKNKRVCPLEKVMAFYFTDTPLPAGRRGATRFGALGAPIDFQRGAQTQELGHLHDCRQRPLALQQ